MTTPKILTLNEVAEATRIPVATLRYYRNQSRGPKSFRAGRRVLFYESEVTLWLEQVAASDERFGDAQQLTAESSTWPPPST